MVFYNLFIFLNNEDAVKDIRWLIIRLLEDEQLEVKFKLEQMEIQLPLKMYDYEVDAGAFP